MGWSIGFDSNWNRDIGYGVPAYCDHPGCMKEIDRGLSYVCGAAPYGGENGCGLFFCYDHRYGENCLCENCLNETGKTFTPVREHSSWIKWKLTDTSWQPWRDQNPEAVFYYKEQLKEHPAPEDD